MSNLILFSIMFVSYTFTIWVGIDCINQNRANPLPIITNSKEKSIEKVQIYKTRKILN